MQEACAEATHATWQRAQEALRAKNQEASSNGGSRSNVDEPQSAPPQERQYTPGKGDLPVFRIPGIQIKLPTAAGIVSFSPLFLSKEQLDRSWVSS